MRAPMMAINTVAAGGGSILHFDGARFRVGPDSAGADPGPACYRRGGPLTVTDANVCVGKIQPTHFPAIFGPNGDQPLDADVVTAKFAALAEEIAQATGEQRDAARRSPRVFCSIAVANMANAIKQVSVQKGHDATRFALQCFGGAGGQHACLVADALGMETVFIHPYAGVLSAYGMGLADQTVMREQAVEIPLEAACHAGTAERCRRGWREEAHGARWRGRARSPSASTVAPHAASALCRHRGGTDRAVCAPRTRSCAEFTEAHRARFGFATPERPAGRRGGRGRGDRAGETVHETHAAASHRRRTRADRTGSDVLDRRRGACRAGVRSHRACWRATASPDRR